MSKPVKIYATVYEPCPGCSVQVRVNMNKKLSIICPYCHEYALDVEERKVIYTHYPEEE